MVLFCVELNECPLILMSLLKVDGKVSISEDMGEKANAFLEP